MYTKVQAYLLRMVMVEKMYHGTIKMQKVIGTQPVDRNQTHFLKEL